MCVCVCACVCVCGGSECNLNHKTAADVQFANVSACVACGVWSAVCGLWSVVCGVWCVEFCVCAYVVMSCVCERVRERERETDRCVVCWVCVCG